jgi:hypothetical protein
MKQKKTLRFSDSDSSASALKVPESKRCMTKSHSSDRKEKTMNTNTTTTAPAYAIEAINGDNRRPGMPADHTALVRHESSPRFGWLCCSTFATAEEAEAFAQTLTPAETTTETPAPKAKRTKKATAEEIKPETQPTTAKGLTLATCATCQAEYKAEAWHTENLCPECYAIAHPKPPKAPKTASKTAAAIAAGIMLAVLITKGTHYAVSVVDPKTGYNFSKVYTLKTHAEALTLAEKMYKNRKLDDIIDATTEAVDPVDATTNARAEETK